jgi:two-component system, cell cycle response regulator
MTESRRILILDEGVEQPSTCHRLLLGNTEADYVISEVNTAEEAIDSIRNDWPDCILLGYNLPDFDRLDLLTELSKRFDDKVPAVVMLTGNASDLVSAQTRNDGALDYLLKSELSAEALRQAIDMAIKKAGQRHLLRLRERALKHLAITDELTGLYDRRYALDHLKDEIYRSERYNVLFSLALIGLDHFRRINEHAGDAVGDDILREIGLLLKKNTRAADITSRYGEDLFLIIIPNTGINEASIFIERILTTIKSLQFGSAAEKTFTMTCSAGLAEYDAGVKSNEAMIERVRKALSQAKNQGRDQLCAWPEHSSLTVTNCHKVLG